MTKATTKKATEEVVETQQMVENGSVTNDLNKRLNDVFTINENDFIETIENTDGTKTDIIKKTYDLVNPIGKRSTMTVYDQRIIESMERIDKAMKAKNMLTFVICKEFSNISKTDKIESMGFKSIAEFGKSRFGLESSTVNHYVRIGKTFINDDYTVKAGLPELSTSHFIELSALVGEDGDIGPIINLYTTGKLTDGMSTKTMRKAIKDLSSNVLVDKKAQSEESSKEEQQLNNAENVGEYIITDKDTEELRANFDKQIAIGKIINACSVVETLFEMLNEHEIEVIGYADNINSIKALAKALL